MQVLVDLLLLAFDLCFHQCKQLAVNGECPAFSWSGAFAHRSLPLQRPLPLLHLLCLIYLHSSIKSHFRYQLFGASQLVFSTDTMHCSDPFTAYGTLPFFHPHQEVNFLRTETGPSTCIPSG